MAFVDPLAEVDASARVEPAIGVWEGEKPGETPRREKPGFVDPLDETVAPVPIPSQKPRNEAWWETLLGAGVKKAIPLPDWFLEGKFNLERPGRAPTLTDERRTPVAGAGLYPSHEEAVEAGGPVLTDLAEGAGTAVSPSLAMSTAANLLRRPATKLGGFLWDTLAPYRSTPLAQNALDVSLGASGGLARGAAGTVTDNPALLTGAQLTGEVGPIAGYGALRGLLGATLAKSFSLGPGAAERAARDELRTLVGDAPGQPSAIGRLEGAEFEAPSIEGFRPTTGELLDSPDLMRAGRQFGEHDEVNRANTLALRRELAAGLPAGDERLPGKVAGQKLLRAQGKTRRAAADERLATEGRVANLEATGTRAAEEAAAAERAAAEKLPDAAGAEARKETASTRLADLTREAEERARRHGGALFDEVTAGVDTANLKSSLYNYREAINRVKRLAHEEGREDALPAGLRGVTDTQGNTTGKYLEDYLGAHTVQGERGFVAQAPYTRTKGLRERLQEELRDRNVSPKQKRYTSMILEGLERDLDEALPNDVLNKDRAARAYWRENVVGRFGHPSEGARNPIADILDGKPVGPTLLKTGEAGGRTADAFVKTFGDEPVGLGTSEAHDRLREYALDAAGRKPEQVKKFLEDHAPFLERFPTLKRDLTAAAEARETADATGTAAAMTQREATRAARRAAIEGEAGAREVEKRGEAMGKTTAAGQYSGDDPVALARQVTSPQEARRVRALFKRDKEAWAGFQRAYYQRITEDLLPARETGAVKGEAIAKFLRDHGKTMDAVLEPAQADHVRRVANALKIQTRAEGLTQVPGTSQTTPLAQQAGELAMRLAIGGKLGAAALRALQSIGVHSRAEAVDLVRRAAVEPEVFKELLRVPDKVRPAKLGLTVRGAALAGTEEAESEEGVLWKKLLSDGDAQ